jgi:U3 small nucleolar RNA-associated protein 25
MFFQRRKRLMMYTERAHFYHRYRIRGIQVRRIGGWAR